ncbi:MAG: formate dehydrogenase subunit gamma [Candidatus Longimicrobiales bacterium M2_2A_002]
MSESTAARDRGDVPLDSAQRGHGPFIWRFNTWDRLFHAFAIISFYTLILTGIPLRFSCAPFSEPLMQFWGGVQRAGLIHRSAAAFMIGYTLIHIVYMAYRFLKMDNKSRFFWGSDSLLPHPDDARDFMQQWKYYFGKGRPPKFGRYGYLEKMDYLGEVWGFFVIGGSGFMLWFPEFFGQYMPGWMFNVATVFHGVEAMLAAAFLFTIHFFNVHLRPDKFPLDAVMFTGRATLEYMEEEHPRMMEAIEARADEPVSERPVKDRRAPSPTRGETLFAAVFGFAAWGVGLATIGMVLWAVFC